MTERVLIIGGGLAGLAAATALAPRGFRVTLLESRNRLGGRASSFHDVASGQLVDTCQHVSMGCCTNFAQFCRTLGIAHLLKRQECLYFMTADRRLSRFRADRLPAPLHLARSFVTAHYLSADEKCRIVYGLACLKRCGDGKDLPFQDWLARHRQTPRTVERFWGLVLTSALNETPDRIGVRYARKVFLDGFIRHRRGFEIELPVVPLGRLYGEEMQAWLGQHGVELRLQTAARGFQITDERVTGVEVRGGAVVDADWYVATVPFDRLLELLPAEIVERHASFHNLRRLETSPITSVHLWYDRPVLRLPHVVLVGCIGQWLFDRGSTPEGGQYVQVVVSASRQFRGLGHEQVERQVTAEVKTLLPACRTARLIRARVVTDHAATFSAVPGVDRWRPPQVSPVANLFLAGDWTATGWPATMEGAVRSGYMAAEGLLKKLGHTERWVQADLWAN
jgi:squalene-associated FAD-dependent desaturase